MPITHIGARITYELAGKFTRFRAVTTLIDEGDTPATPLVFRVLGDGNELWKSKTIQRRVNQVAEFDSCDVSIAGVQRLELVVDCPGSDIASASVWINPQVSR